MRAAWRPAEGGLALQIRLTPRAHCDRLDGVVNDGDGGARLAARVRAVPEAGKANAALLRLIADELSLPASALSIARGASARSKTVLIAGRYDDLAERLAALCGQTG